jgi:hypothetical protein
MKSFDQTRDRNDSAVGERRDPHAQWPMPKRGEQGRQGARSVDFAEA